MMRRLLPALLLFACPAVKPAVNDAGTGGGGGGAVTGGGAGGGSAGGGGGGTLDAGTDAGVQSVCGDARVTGLESCDDGFLVPGDGCSIGCAVELGWFCQLPPPGQPSVCVPNCGDGRLVANEPCDDGNFRNNDGCSSTCAVEPGFTCTGTPSRCTVSCGDGIVGGTETCDDGNQAGADGCSMSCAQEPGFTCLGMPNVCRPTCGDGMLVTGEVCDDGFMDACGACNSNCTAVGSGSSCGDGTRCPQTEQCDDNNQTSNDGCSSTCTLEAGNDAGSTPDAGVDAGTTPVDAGSTPDAGGGTDAGTPVSDGGMGAFVYQRITNITFVDDLTRVTWHPSGRFALVLGAGGKVIKYDATARTLSLVQNLGTTLADLDVTADGTAFVIAGLQSTTSHLWRIDVGAGDVLAAAVDLGTLLGTVSAVSVEPGTSRFAAVSRGNPSINYLYLWSPAAGLSTPKGYNASGGALTLMWGSPALYGGSANVLTGDGVNGADSKTWVEASNLFVGNAWSGGFGNPGGGAWQPGGGWGAFCGWSSNKLYVFDGAWTLITLPGNTGISPQALAFRADGRRGLVVGRPVGNPLTGTVIEYRASGTGTLNASELMDVSIPGFNLTPWFGTSNEYLMDAAWRPGACDEGLIVGMDNGTSLSPTFGLAIRFYDASNCSP